MSSAGAYLLRQLPRIAQDPEQDFPLFRREIRKCREHLETVIRNQAGTQRGAPCPDCLDKGSFVRLNRIYPHWCEDEDCERIHYSQLLDPLTGELEPDETGDRWVCPADKAHWMTPEGYAQWLKDRHEEMRSASA